MGKDDLKTIFSYDQRQNWFLTSNCFKNSIYPFNPNEKKNHEIKHYLLMENLVFNLAIKFFMIVCVNKSSDTFDSPYLLMACVVDYKKDNKQKLKTNCRDTFRI